MGQNYFLGVYRLPRSQQIFSVDIGAEKICHNDKIFLLLTHASNIVRRTDKLTLHSNDRTSELSISTTTITGFLTGGHTTSDTDFIELKINFAKIERHLNKWGTDEVG